MVELVTNELSKRSNLERELIAANIQYQIVLDIGNYGVKPPFIVVDGVPLDEKRALVWIKESKHDE